MNQSTNTDSKNSKEPQQKYRLGTVSIKILGGLNRFYGRPTSPSASIMAQNIQSDVALCLQVLLKSITFTIITADLTEFFADNYLFQVQISNV